MSFKDYSEEIYLEETKKHLNNTKIKLAIMQLFSTDKKVTEMDVKSLAKKLNVDHERLEDTIFGLLSSLLYKRHKKVFKVDPHELKLGLQQEKEHTSDVNIAKKIVMDHLAEIPNYYSLLASMEKSAKS